MLMGFYGCAWKQKQPSNFIILRDPMTRNEIKDWIVMALAFGTILLLFVITLGDFWVAMENSREVSKDVINLLSMSITGIVGIIAGYISGKNAGDQAKQHAADQQAAAKP